MTIRDLNFHIRKLNWMLITGIGLIFTCVIGILDSLTGYELSFSILYLAPISLGAWYAGKWSGVGIAVVSGLVWLLADLAAGHSFQNPFAPYYNLAVILSEFVLVGLIVSALQGAYQRQTTLTEELREALRNIRTLRGLIPICAWCKKVRDDKGYWQEVEAYLAERSEAAFTHGLCPKCHEEMRSKIAENISREPQ